MLATVNRFIGLRIWAPSVPVQDSWRPLQTAVEGGPSAAGGADTDMSLPEFSRQSSHTVSAGARDAYPQPVTILPQVMLLLQRDCGESC